MIRLQLVGGPVVGAGVGDEMTDVRSLSHWIESVIELIIIGVLTVFWVIEPLAAIGSFGLLL